MKNPRPVMYCLIETAGEFGVCVLEFAELFSFAPECFCDDHARDEERFTSLGGQVRQRALHLTGQSTSSSADDARQICKYRHREDGDDSQFP